ncbi:MAG: response regulator [Burkholderiales bacterium]
MRDQTILIVDDSPGNLMVLGEVLSPVYRVQAANSGARALELAAGDPKPDLILLDVMMPGLDGYATLERLRADPATREIPVIFVTAMDTDEDEQRGLDHGAVDYITKPIRPAIVLARVQTHVELAAARAYLHDRNRWLESEVRKRMRENEDIQDASIHALARLAATRDWETGNHLRRTQEYVRTLATELARHPKHAQTLSPRVIDQYAKSAPLHDIGKVGIPDGILRKPGPLDAEEWLVMRTHPTIGANAILEAGRDAGRPIDFLEIARDMVAGHHERYDGSGYPLGLAGDDIPLPARLMAIADVFDALLSRRVYKGAKSFEDACAMIIAERGRHFDPDVVDAFLATRTLLRDISERWSDAPQDGPSDDTPAAEPLKAYVTGADR